MKRIYKTMNTLLIMVTALVTFNALATNNNHDKQKVVYHINYDNAKRQSSTLNSLQNHINAVGADNLDIRVIVHGNGLSMFLKPEAHKNVPQFKHANATINMTKKIDILKNQGVLFNICANTVKAHNINPDKDLYKISEEAFVPSGVAELAYLQKQGFVYLSP